MNTAGSYFIQHYVDKTEVGLYQLGNTLAAAVGLASAAFLQAWSPFAFSIAKDENHRRTYANIFLLYVYWSSLALLGMFLFASEVLMILAPPAFSDASFVAALLGLNIVIMSLPQITGIGCSLAKTNMPYSKAVIVGSIISVVLFMILIPLAGKEGAVLATIIGNTFVFLYVYYWAQKLYFIPYNLLKAMSALAAALGLSFLGLWMTHNQPLYYGLGIKIFLFAAYAIFIVHCTFKIKSEIYVHREI
jgi:O-antigen/teichoic acid export membrane protein